MTAIERSGAARGAGGSRVRAGMWAQHVAIPVPALWLLIAQPQLVAARLQGLAEPGCVVIGESTYALLANLADCEPLG